MVRSLKIVYREIETSPIHFCQNLLHVHSLVAVCFVCIWLTKIYFTAPRILNSTFFSAKRFPFFFWVTMVTNRLSASPTESWPYSHILSAAYEKRLQLKQATLSLSSFANVRIDCMKRIAEFCLVSLCGHSEHTDLQKTLSQNTVN